MLIISFIKAEFIGQKITRTGEQIDPSGSITDVYFGGKPSEEEGVFCIRTMPPAISVGSTKIYGVITI